MAALNGCDNKVCIKLLLELTRNDGSRHAAGNPNAATRGSRGAAALALGRRIMESANHMEARRQASARAPGKID